jgi:pyrophosphatase PpaX
VGAEGRGRGSSGLPGRPGNGGIRTVLFDLDGTLIDSAALILASCHHTMEAHGLPAMSDDEWLRHMGTPLTSHFAAWKDDRGTMEAMIATYRAFNSAHHDGMIREFPGVVDVVRALRAAGLGVGVVTSKLTWTAARGLRLFGLEDAMDVVVCADMVTNPKPHPEPVETAVRMLGADPRTTVYVGDSIHDMLSGRAAGVLTAAVLWGPFTRSQLEPAEPDFWLEEPAQLLDLVSEPGHVSGSR